MLNPNMFKRYYGFQQDLIIIYTFCATIFNILLWINCMKTRDNPLKKDDNFKIIASQISIVLVKNSSKEKV